MLAWPEPGEAKRDAAIGGVPRHQRGGAVGGGYVGEVDEGGQLVVRAVGTRDQQRVVAEVTVQVLVVVDLAMPWAVKSFFGRLLFALRRDYLYKVERPAGQMALPSMATKSTAPAYFPYSSPLQTKRAQGWPRSRRSWA